MEVQKQKENSALKLCSEIKVSISSMSLEESSNLPKDHQQRAYCRVLKYKIGIKSR